MEYKVQWTEVQPGKRRDIVEMFSELDAAKAKVEELRYLDAGSGMIQNVFVIEVKTPEEIEAEKIIADAESEEIGQMRLRELRGENKEPPKRAVTAKDEKPKHTARDNPRNKAEVP